MTILAGTMQTDPRSGGLKRSSGVNVMPSIAEGTKYAQQHACVLLLSCRFVPNIFCNTVF
jgi:hypothetical protein